MAILLFLDTDAQLKSAFILAVIIAAIPAYFVGRAVRNNRKKVGDKGARLAGVAVFIVTYLLAFAIILVIISSQIEFRR